MDTAPFHGSQPFPALGIKLYGKAGLLCIFISLGYIVPCPLLAQKSAYQGQIALAPQKGPGKTGAGGKLHKHFLRHPAHNLTHQVAYPVRCRCI